MRFFMVSLVLLGVLFGRGAAGAVEGGQDDPTAASLGIPMPEAYSFARFLMNNGYWEEAQL